MTGFLDFRIILTAFLILDTFPFDLFSFSKDLIFSSISNFEFSARIFLGKFTHTGPLLGVIDSLNALLKTLGICLTLLTVQVFFVIGLNSDC